MDASLLMQERFPLRGLQTSTKDKYSWPYFIIKNKNNKKPSDGQKHLVHGLGGVTKHIHLFTPKKEEGEEKRSREKKEL